MNKVEKLTWSQLSRNEKRLWHAACEARKKAKVFISGNAVGAAVLTDIGNVYAGWNDESLGMSMVVHAEVNAILAMRRAEKNEEIVALMAVAPLGGVDDGDRGFLCARCRQALWDATGNPQLVAYDASVDARKDICKATLGDLYPYPHPTRRRWLEKNKKEQRQ